MRLFFATLALFLFSSVLCGSSDYSDEICFERPSTGDKLLFKNDKIYFSDPSNPFACHVWDFCRSLVPRGATEYTNSFVPIRLTDSKCFVPGSAVCRDPAAYFIDFSLFDQHKILDTDRVLDICVSSSRIRIGTSSDTCCERTNALIGEWVPSSNCSCDCDCSTSCDLLDECLVREVKGNQLALRSVDGSLIVSGDSDACFVYPTVRKESRLTVGQDICRAPLNNFGPLYTRSRTSCDDASGTYFCSQREDTLTLFYTDDFCESRTAVLGATFHTVDCRSCPAVCTCTGNDFPSEGEGNHGSSSHHGSSDSDSESEGEGQTGSSSHSGSSAGQGQTGGSSSHSGTSAGQGQTGGSSSHSGSSAGQGQTGGSSSHSGTSAGQGQTGGSSQSSSHSGTSAGQAQTSGNDQSSHHSKHSSGAKLGVPAICILAVGIVAFLV